MGASTGASGEGRGWGHRQGRQVRAGSRADRRALKGASGEGWGRAGSIARGVR